MPRKVVGIAAVAVTMLIATLLPASPAFAVVRPGAPATVRAGNTQLILSATGPGTSVNGYIADPSNAFDPTTGYPTSPPPPGTGWTAQGESFAGVIYGSPTDGSPALEMYCINIRTDTYIGVGYELGTWDSANVSNIGYVARLLNTYYPETNEPSTITNLDQKAAAVQAAIWFFSDRYVLSTSDPLHDAVAAIVADVIGKGAIVEPPPPTLSITPSSRAGPVGSVIGPFTVTSTTVGDATVSAAGGTMYSDASGTTVIPDGSTVKDGTQIWVRSTGPSAVALLATATATVPSGNAYLYDQNSPGLADAQKLILAKEATLRTTVSASAQFQLPGSLTVVKTIAGPAAGHQGPVVIQVVCDGVAQSPDFRIPSGTGAGEESQLYSPIDAGSVCQVNELQDGHTHTVTVTTTGDGGQATIPADANVDVRLTDTYDFVPGSLIVKKSIEGPAAGQQSQITISVSCVAGGVTTHLPDFVIPARATGEQTKQYDDITANSVCTVTEPGNGSNAGVAPPVTVLPGPVTVPAARTVEAAVTDTYTNTTGSILVAKTITGPAAGTQGQITITVSCVDLEGNPVDPALTPDFVIPAGATGVPSKLYSGLPGRSTCTILETEDGTSSGLADRVSGSGRVVIVPPGNTSPAVLTDNYETGVLVVNKTIDGDAAGQQGQVTIDVTCGGTAQAPFMIPAGTASGTVSMTYTALAGQSCTVTEPQDGSVPGTVLGTTTGVPATVTIAANDTGEVNVTNTYSFAPGSLTVTKALSGPSAGSQGAITIQVSCLANGIPTDLPDFTIPAGTAAGSPALTHTYTGVAGTSACTFTETVDGSSSTVDVITDGSGQTVTVPAGGAGTATITDTYTPADGSLLLSKTISGPSAGQQGAVTIDVTCGTTTFPTFVIAAQTKAGTYTHGVDGIPAGSTCTVTETNDGSTSTVVVTVSGDPLGQPVPVPAGTVVPFEIDNVYSDGPGNLVVTKTLTGTAAGQQGPISILVDCGGPETFALDIPAGTAAGPVPQTFDTIPAGSTCTVQETVNGGSDTIAVAAVGSDQSVTIPAGGTASVAMVDSFAALTSAPAQELAFTGTAARRLGLLGAALIAVGALAVAGARPRRRRGRNAGSKQ